MTSAEIRQSFLDFFASKGHTIVPSSSLIPDSPGLLFTNAGMNQFVPIFLGDRAPNVSKWAGAKPAKDTRAADTQKCIRAGGKHNDLEDVGFDTYHHTMFEMLSNWSFGDYFKRESLTWGWELITKVWGIPAKRLFATIYNPDESKGNSSERDEEAYAIWAELFKKEGLDYTIHIVSGNKKNNFWMMSDTGPCGPCSEIHINLLPSDDESEGRKLVNSSSPRCIEIWNHVFIEFNANVDGTFTPLAAKHVDTGMGFERIAGICATTKGFKDFSAVPSNYNADLFAPLFQKVAALSGKAYQSTVPTKRENLTEQENIDIAFRVLVDHTRCISCAIADGIMPGNDGRNYVIRRILRRGILYGKKIGFQIGNFSQLVTPVVESLGHVFPELKQQQEVVCRVIANEEGSFGRTLDRGLALFEKYHVVSDTLRKLKSNTRSVFKGCYAFELYDTYGFPLDMTQLLAAERGLIVDTKEFDVEMEKQRKRTRAAQKKEVFAAVTTTSNTTIKLKPTTFLGYTLTETMTGGPAALIGIVKTEKDTFLVFDQTPFYAEMGGQVGDTGHALINHKKFEIVDTVKDKAGRHLHKLAIGSTVPVIGMWAKLVVDAARRRSVSRHHSAAHLIHWALRKVLGTHIRQAGASKTPDHMRFDFSHFEAMTAAQVKEIEQLANKKVLENAVIETYETEFDKKPEDTLAFFGDKYAKIVHIVDIGGYSRELCGGTHATTTGEIGLIKIVDEMAIATGTRRIEAVAGQPAYDFVAAEESALKAVNARINASVQDVAQKLEAVLTRQKELEQKLKAYEAKASAGLAEELAAKAVEKESLKWVSAIVPADNLKSLRWLGSQVLNKLGEGVVQFGALFGNKAAVVAFCSPAAIKAGHQAGNLVSALSNQLGGKGGGGPDFAMGGGKDASKLADILK